MSATISCNFLPILVFLCSLIAHFSEKGHANQETSGPITNESSDTSFYVVNVSSLIIPERCDSKKSSSGRSKEGASLELVHRHRPNPHNIKTSAPTLAEVLFQDKARLRYLHLSSRLSKKDVFKVSEATTLNIMSGIHYRAAGAYVVTVGLGAQKTRLTLLFDTGSPLTWTQCMPCLQQCYKQREQIFNPSNSTSYTSIGCDSTLCREFRGGCYKNSCIYGQGYGEESYEEGFIGKDTLALTRSDVFKKFLFGCGQNNKGTFGETAGILGLSRGKLSFVSQTAQKYREYFSYCLPSSVCKYGHLTFGDSGVGSRSINFTQLLKPPPKFPLFYFINLTAISVAGKKLAIKGSVFPKEGAIIDSGTTITCLPSEAHGVLRSAFMNKMTKYPRASNIEDLDTCYDLSHYTTVRIPKISLFFGGRGAEVELPVHQSGILYGTNKSQLCLAFVSNGDVSDFTIIGNVQQRTFEVVYDVAGGKLGFAPNSCS